MPFIEALGQFSYRVGKDLHICYESFHLGVLDASKQD
jgi:hypothetical protein